MRGTKERERNRKHTIEKERTARPTLTLGLLLALCVAGWVLEQLEGPAAAETGPAIEGRAATEGDALPTGAFLVEKKRQDDAEVSEEGGGAAMPLIEDLDGGSFGEPEAENFEEPEADGEGDDGGEEPWTGTDEASGNAELYIVPHLRGEARRRHDEAMRIERERVGRATAAWCPGFLVALRPVREAADRAAGSLSQGWGPISRNVAYPLEVALGEIEESGVLPAPDPAIDKRLRQALTALREGAAACAQGLPTTARTKLEAGRQGLAATEAGLMRCGVQG